MIWGGQPGRVWEGPTVWSQLLLGSKAGGLRQVMSSPGRVSSFQLQTRRAHDRTDVRGWSCAGHRANPWAPASSALEGEKTRPLETISRSLEKFGEWTACSTDGRSRRGALWAPDGGSQRDRCREPPLWSLLQACLQQAEIAKMLMVARVYATPQATYFPFISSNQRSPSDSYYRRPGVREN